MITLEEHRARIEEIKAAEARVRYWVENPSHHPILDTPDVRLLLERIDAYEASITWHTDCLTCPKLLDQIYEMDQHTIPELREKYKNACADRDGLRDKHDLHLVALEKADRLAESVDGRLSAAGELALENYRAAREKVKP